MEPSTDRKNKTRVEVKNALAYNNAALIKKFYGTSSAGRVCIGIEEVSNKLDMHFEKIFQLLHFTILKQQHNIKHCNNNSNYKQQQQQQYKYTHDHAQL